MGTKVFSIFERKKREGVILTDELLDVLADEYMQKNEKNKDMTFFEWVEYRKWQLSNY